MNNLKDKNLKVLVGLEIEKSIMKRVKEVETVIVAPELPGIISRENNEKAGVEKLAELEYRLLFNFTQQYHFPEFIGTGCLFLIIKHLSALYH